MAATGDPVEEERLPKLVNDFVVHYGEHIADGSVPFPGVIETLTGLKKNGVPMGVLTNKPQELALPLLDALNMSSFFGAIHGAGRFSYVKPDPRVFHHVVEELAGNSNAPAVMVGDSTTDAKTARAANVPVILLSYGYTPDPVETLGADAVTGNFRDIPTLVREIFAR
jgi:phosphoglycolate phosphatase